MRGGVHYVVETVVTRRGSWPQFSDDSWVPVEYFHIHHRIKAILRSRAMRFRWRPPGPCEYHITFVGWLGDMSIDGAMGVIFHVDHPCGPLLLLYSIRSSTAVAPVLQPWELRLPIADVVGRFRDANNRPLAYTPDAGIGRGVRRIGYFV